MFRVAIGFLILALVAAIFGFGGLAGTAAGFAKIVLVIAVILAIVSFFLGGRGSRMLALVPALFIPLGASQAQAQTAFASAEAEVRTGATFGVSLGGGHIGCTTGEGDDCDDQDVREAGGLAVHAGAMIAPGMALIGELWGMRHEDDRVTLTQMLATANLRFWAADVFWLQGGVGVARSEGSFDGDFFEITSRTDTVPAATAALGVELVRAPTFGLDLQLKGGTGFYEDDIRLYNLSLGVGASWY